MFLVHGQNAFDIFEALVHILKAKCLEIFGDTLVFSRATFESDTKQLKDFFQYLGIKLLLDLQEDNIRVKKCNSHCVLKDYKLWIKMPCTTNLAISFDYVSHKSTACHLE